MNDNVLNPVHPDNRLFSRLTDRQLKFYQQLQFSLDDNIITGSEGRDMEAFFDHE